jgi:ABC-2 type transport system ATP-binding protein
MRHYLRVSDVSQGYRTRPVIRNIDFSAGPGVVGLLGPNGAGKSTLLRTMAAVMPPRSGAIEICGVRVLSERDARRARRNIGYLPQDFGFYPAFSVVDFVSYCAWLRGVPSRRTRKAAMEAVDRVGLSGRAKDSMKSLSGGMLRRAGIAAALVGSPKVVLLDEPTVGLDPGQRLEFRELLRSLTDTAIVLSTHLVEDVAAVCDEIAVLHEGRFVFRGSPEKLSGSALPGAAGDNPLERGYMSVLQGAAS